MLQWTCTLLIGLLFPSTFNIYPPCKSNLLIILFFVAVVKAVGQAGVFFGFGGIGVVMLIIFFIMLPETRAKSE